MKKTLYGILALTMAASLAGCSAKNDNTGSSTADNSSTETSEPDTEKGEGVMTYAEYDEAAINDEVTIETYVQAKQSWWDNKGTFYTQDEDGGYFIYEMPVSEEDYNKLVEGQKIRVSGKKAEWNGEFEIIDATYEILEGSWVAPAKDVTDALGKDELADYINQKVVLKDMKIEPAEFSESDTNEVYKNEAGEEQGFMYKADGSGKQGDDVYFTASKDGANYTFVIESYLTDSSTDVYKAAESLEIGKTYDLEGFLYWYNGPNPHITVIKAK